MGGGRPSVVFLIFIFMAVQDLTWGSGSAGSVSVTYDAAQSSGEQEVSISTSDNTALVERQMTVVLSTVHLRRLGVVHGHRHRLGF